MGWFQKQNNEKPFTFKVQSPIWGCVFFGDPPKQKNKVSFPLGFPLKPSKNGYPQHKDRPHFDTYPPPGTQAKGPSDASAQVVLKNPVAKVETSAALMRKEMASAAAESTAVYLLACLTCSWSPLSHTPRKTMLAQSGKGISQINPCMKRECAVLPGILHFYG